MSSVFGHHRSVRFQEVDAAGIVFFSRFFEYFHDAFVELLRSHQIELMRLAESDGWTSPLVHAEADYKSPVKYGDHICVQVVRGQLGRSSLTVHYEVRPVTNTDILHCTGKTVHVFVNKKTFQSMTVPDEVKRAFQSYGVTSV